MKSVAFILVAMLLACTAWAQERPTRDIPSGSTNSPSPNSTVPSTGGRTNRPTRQPGVGPAATEPTVGGDNRKNLPTVELVDTDGNNISSSDILMVGKWIVVYVENDCRSCTDLLKQLKKDDLQSLGKNLVIVVGEATPEKLNKFKEAFRDLDKAAWFADADRSLFKNLNAGSAPLILGIHDNSIEWQLAGSTPASGDMKSVLRSWWGS